MSRITLATSVKNSASTIVRILAFMKNKGTNNDAIIRVIAIEVNLSTGSETQRLEFKMYQFC
jgi:hypothetical protein